MTLAKTLASLTERLVSEPIEQKGAVVDELRAFVMSVDPVRSAEDALAFQTLAMSLAQMVHQIGVPIGGNPMLDLMYWAMRRTAMHLETVSGQSLGDIVSELSAMPPAAAQRRLRLR